MSEDEGSCEAADAGLDAAHDIKHEVDLDPEVHLPSGSSMPAPILDNTIVKVEQFTLHDCSVLIKVERLDETHYCSACHRTFNHETILESHKCREDIGARETYADVPEIGDETEDILNTDGPVVCLETQAHACINNASISGESMLESTQKNDRNVLMRLLMKDCYVRIERLNLERTSAHNQDSRRDIDEESSVEEDNTRVDYEYKQYTCDYCGRIYTVKPRLIKHISWHMHMHKMADKGEDIYGADNGVVLNEARRSGNKTHNNIIINNNPSHIREKSNTCNICGLTFAPNASRTHECSNINLSKDVGKDKYVCHICKKTLSKKNNFKKHIMLCKMLSCDVCGKEVSNQDFEMHKIYHAADTLYKCEVCEKGFKNLRNLKFHLTIHTGKKPFQCDICEKRFVSLPNLKHHKKIHRSDKQYHCDSCGKTFSHLGGLKYHVTIHGVDKTYDLLKRYTRPQKKQHLCKVCKKVFTCPSLLNYHERLHTGEKPYICTICKKTFRMKSSLTQHHKRHHQDSRREVSKSRDRDKYTCNICKREIVSKAGLKAHERLHTGEKPYACECGRRFIHITSLYRHRKSHKKGFSCKICPSIFTQSQSLDRHMTFHSKDMQSCTICGKEVLKSSFKYHEQYHSEEMYSCEICEKGFKTLRILRRHLQVHSVTDKKQFSCDLCSKRYSHKHTLVKHMQSHQGDKKS